MRRCAALVLVLAVFAVPAAFAGWPSDPAINLPLTKKAGDQIQPKVLPFPGGGFVMAWFDNQPTGSPPAGYDVMLQRYDAAGNPLWTAGGVVIADRGESATQDYGFDIDASGNTYLAFNDDRFTNEQITATKIDPGGNQLWGPKGVQVSSGAAAKSSPRVTVCTDGQVVVGWTIATGMHLYRLTSAGALVWDRTITAPTGRTYSLSALHAADAGTVIYSFVRVISSSGARQLLTNKYTTAGVPSWGATGVVLLDNASLQMGNFPEFVHDGAGGAVYAWYTASPLAVYAQHVVAAGTEGWAHNGISCSTDASHDHAEPEMAYDRTTGSTYVIFRELSNFQAYSGVAVQKLNSAGARQWTDSGLIIRPLVYQLLTHHVLVTMLGGNPLFLWMEEPAFAQDQFFAQKLDPSGAVLCPTFGVSTLVSYKSRNAVATDVTGAAITVFEDQRAGDSDIFGQNINTDCTLGSGAVPLEVSPPGAAQPLAFIDGATLTWEPKAMSGADTFNLYRGDTADLAQLHYGACAQSGLTSSIATDATLPAAQHANFYLVSGRNANGEGTLGSDTAGNRRYPLTPCP